MVRLFLKRGHGLHRFSPGLQMSAQSSPSLSSSQSGSPNGASPLTATTRVLSRSYGSKTRQSPDLPPLTGGKPGQKKVSRSSSATASVLAGDGGPPSDMELMREKFSKLLLGEDMSGTGKGVSSALALSNAITNLAASVFGQQRRLEPMAADRKGQWRKEIDWLVSVADQIVEFVPSQLVSNDGTNMEIMVTQQRRDLLMNIPALRKLDAMLLEYLDNFKDSQEFWYVSKDADESEKGNVPREDDKWWIPTVKVPPNGLSGASRKWLQYQKDLVGQVLKAAMAINANVLMEMEVPEAYIESLPKNGRSSLGDAIYKIITDDYFDPNELLKSVDLSSEHNIVDLKNRIEASVVIWQRKMSHKDAKSSWGHGVSHERREQFEGRAETVLLLLKHRFPGIAQSALDISKIQYNRDVGYAILESYSRTLESLAFTVLSRIEDVLYADSVAQDRQQIESGRILGLSDDTESVVLNAKAEVERLRRMEPISRTLSDFVGWQEQDLEAMMKDSHNMDGTMDGDGPKLTKDARIATKRFSYLEKLENLGGMRSPRSRH